MLNLNGATTCCKFWAISIGEAAEAETYSTCASTSSVEAGTSSTAALFSMA